MDVEDVESDEQIEELEDASKEISKDEGRRSLKLWFAVLGSPMAWSGHLGVNYSLEEWFACSTAAHHKGEILGFSVNTVSIAFNTLMVVIAAASGLVALACWKGLKDAKGDEKLERARWMAFAGMVEGAMFLGIILLGYLPPLTLGTCETTP